MKDLLKLYNIYSVHSTNGETKICDWIMNRLKEIGITDIQRKGNNIWRFTGTSRILLSAHLDQVPTNNRAEHFYLSDNGIIKAYNKDWERTSLGADDKNGVWLILKMLELKKDIDFIISEGEEAGCVGIKSIESIIKNSTADFAIVLDRKGNTDILKGGGGDVYCDALATNLKNFLNSFEDNNYIVTTGSISDTRVICKYIESVNMCVNYEDAHTKNETTDWNALNKTLKNLQRIEESFVHYKSPPSSYSVKDSYKNYYSKRMYNSIYGDSYDEY